MEGIEPGMTPHEVVDMVGPPLNAMDEAGLVGNSWSVGTLTGALWWLYEDVPRPGITTQIAFTQGVVELVKTWEAPMGQASEPREWVRGLVGGHVARMEQDYPELARYPGWRELTGPQVRDFLVNVPASLDEGLAIYALARRFGHLDVLVSTFATVDTARIRERLPDGYVQRLIELVALFGIRPWTTDVAHWILCRENEKIAVHLAFVPVVQGVPCLLPGDLRTSHDFPT
ncbi:hypothetical protein [Actinomadura terrae]|uniref:hypothetical protein n=1 Tax=Actinomadura terrae TaxID=604353 RepID=UPI001FA8160C|nr:hypothetical protein [Actinomadura terrae]